ncbi:MAG: toll/interleukin-1 receptor domain-containing protein [Chloroflexi bacterium]|nr:toll/interleukin-1 receptor domain-containing protein [Chloroflexota bacterium]
MALFTEAAVRARAQRAATNFSKTASAVLTAKVESQASVAQHDVFLSHAYEDREKVLGAALMIEDLGYSVYIDWRDDSTLDRSKITRATAEKLRVRMMKSKSLFYSTTENASESKWMPWELGFKDGDNRKVAVLPIMKNDTGSFTGQEYLGIYPYVTHGKSTNGKRYLWIRYSSNCYINFDHWLEGKHPYEH